MVRVVAVTGCIWAAINCFHFWIYGGAPVFMPASLPWAQIPESMSWLWLLSGLAWIKFTITIAVKGTG